MIKETIMNNYAIEQGYDSWRELVMDHVFDSDGVLNYEDLIDHQNAVTDLIQEELKRKVNVVALDSLELFNSEYEILSNAILKTEIL